MLKRTLLCHACLLWLGIAAATADPKNSGYQTDPPLDLTFETGGSANLFTATGGCVSPRGGALEFTFSAPSTLTSPSLDHSRNGIYNPTLDVRNTMFFIMENRSTADRLRLSFITDEDRTFDEAKSKVFAIDPQSPKKAYYFNLSDCPKAKGRLAGFRIEPLDGSGKLLIDRITFEQEKRIEPVAGTISSCTADDRRIEIRGEIAPQYRGRFDRIAVYETSMMLSDDDPSQMTKLYEGPLGERFDIARIPLRDGRMTRLSSQFLAVASNSRGEWMKIGPRFYIGNWCDFENNPYSFELPGRSVSVLDFGAEGDSFTDDTDAIQAAIDAVSEQGGGRVCLPGDTTFYGRRYVATNIRMKSNVELHIASNAVLWQSQDERDYKYKPTYGHEGSIPGINWTHNMHVSNLPLIQGKEIENIKITGPGKIRSLDVESEDDQFPDYRRHCNDRIHVIPIGLWGVKNIEVSDLEIVRSNNYHTAFYACENVFVGNLKMHEVQCVSGDGLGLGVGTHNVKIVRAFLESNDDGVVLWAGYNDPRGLLWWWARPEADNSIRNITACHSYINSGGGKAIAFIPWGTDNPDLSKSQIDSIVVYDCVLHGGYAVGTWPDNPYNGMKPFDNTEQNDYSPVKNVRIRDNRYLSECNLLCIRPTNFISDCGIVSSGTFRNGRFADGTSYWTMEGDAGAENSEGYVRNGKLYEGLYLQKGTYRLTADVRGTGTLFAEHAETGRGIARLPFRADRTSPVALNVRIPQDGTYYLGIGGGDARIARIGLDKK